MKSQSSNETAFAYHTIASNGNNNKRPINIPDTNEKPPINLRVYIEFIFKNSYGYSLFDLYLVLNYTNNQLTYYYITGAIFGDNQPRFYQLIK